MGDIPRQTQKFNHKIQFNFPQAQQSNPNEVQQLQQSSQVYMVSEENESSSYLDGGDPIIERVRYSLIQSEMINQAFQMNMNPFDLSFFQDSQSEGLIFDQVGLNQTLLHFKINQAQRYSQLANRPIDEDLIPDDQQQNHIKPNLEVEAKSIPLKHNFIQIFFDSEEQINQHSESDDQLNEVSDTENTENQLIQSQIQRKNKINQNNPIVINDIIDQEVQTQTRETMQQAVKGQNGSLFQANQRQIISRIKYFMKINQRYINALTLNGSKNNPIQIDDSDEEGQKTIAQKRMQKQKKIIRVKQFKLKAKQHKLTQKITKIRNTQLNLIMKLSNCMNQQNQLKQSISNNQTIQTAN